MEELASFPAESLFVKNLDSGFTLIKIQLEKISLPKRFCRGTSYVMVMEKLKIMARDSVDS